MKHWAILRSNWPAPMVSPLRTPADRRRIKDERKARDWGFSTSASRHSILGSIPPLTSDNYRAIMTTCAAYLLRVDIR